MKLRTTYQFIILIFILSSCKQKEPGLPKVNIEPTLQAQKEEYQSASIYKPSSTFDHIQYIRQHSRIGKTDGIEHHPNYFVDYTIEELLESKHHKKYITDRKLLRRLQNKTCWNDYVSIVDTLQNGDDIEIEIKTQEFNTSNRRIKYHEKSNYLVSIDDKYPYGAVYSRQPKKEIVSLTININGKELRTSISNYQNLYEPEFCNFGSYQRITEAYEDGDNIYIYIFGGNAADSYFGKLIFDKTNGYITSIVADYGPLSKYGCFGKHFIGF